MVGNPWQISVRLGVTLAQGGEFAFVLFSAASSFHLLPSELSDRLILVVTLSMALTPLTFWLLEKKIEPLWAKKEQRAFDEIGEDDHYNPIVIAGFGRFGQIIARVLRMHKIRFTPLKAMLVRWILFGALAITFIMATLVILRCYALHI